MTHVASEDSQNWRTWLAQRINIPIEFVIYFVVVSDLSTVLLSSLFSMEFCSVNPRYQTIFSNINIVVSAISGIIYVHIGYGVNLYQIHSMHSSWNHLSRSVAPLLATALWLSAVLFLLRIEPAYPPAIVVDFIILVVPSLFVVHLAISRLVGALIGQGAVIGRPTVVIGEDRELNKWSVQKLLLDYGCREVARIAIEVPRNPSALSSCEVMIDYAVRLAREQRADEILVAVGWNNTELLQTVKSRLSVSAVPARLVPDRALTPVLERGRVWRPRPMLTVELQRAPLSNAERRAKRVFDFVLACTALVVLSPIMAMAAAAVRWDTPGPVLFRQRRTGFDGEKFSIFKFRTMNVMEDGAHVVQARRDDARITRTGAFLRRTSIDELPQLFNVLRGEMSLVGPRPHAVCHDQHYQKLISEYVFRFHVKPGITGWAQVHGCRGEISRLEDMEHRLALDLWYVRNWSFQTDLRIIIRTCFEIMRQDAY